MLEGELRGSFAQHGRNHLLRLPGASGHKKSSGLRLRPSSSQLLHTLINNIVQNPQEAKFRSFKPTQPKIARDIFSVPGGPELLIEAGFRKKVVSFVESWSLPEPVAQSQSAPEISAAILRRLQIVEGALRSSAENAEIQHERADLHRQAEAEAEKNRKVSPGVSVCNAVASLEGVHCAFSRATRDCSGGMLAVIQCCVAQCTSSWLDSIKVWAVMSHDR